MPLEGRVLKKGDTEKFFFADQLDRAKSAGWKETGGSKAVRVGSDETVIQVSEGQLAELQGSNQEISPVSPTERSSLASEEIRRRTYDTAGNEALAVLSGVGSGATLGLSDYLVGALGYEDELRAISEVNPLARGVGEVAGVLGPALLTGGAGLAGAAARATPAGAVAGLSRAGIKGAIAEGAIFGGAQAVDNLYLSDKPFAADAVLAEMGSGALFGGALGGAVGLAGAGFGKLASKIDDGALRKANPILEEGSEGYKRVSREIASELDRPGSVRAQALDDLGGDAPIQTFKRYSGEILEGSAKKLGTVAQNLDDSVRKAITSKGEVSLKKIGKLSPDAVEKLAIDITESEKLTAAIAEAAGTTYQPTQLAAKLENIATQEGLSLPMTGGDKSQLFALAENLGVTDASAWVENATGSETAGAIVNLWAAAKTMSSMARGAPGAGGFFKGAAGKAIGNLSRKPAGALGQLVGGMGSAYGRAKEGIASGVGKFVKVAARAAGSKAAVPVATTVLGKVRFDPNVGEEPDKRSVFKQRSAELDRAVANPTATAERIRKKLAPVNHVDPELGDLLLQNAMNKLMFYHGKAPRNPLESMGLYRVGRWEPPASELARFARYVRAGEDPLSLLSDLENGRVTPEAVEAVKALYPEMYSRMQLEIVTQLAEPGAVEALDYSKRVQLKIFFDLPTDPTLTDEFYATMQDLYVMRNEQAQQGSSQYSTPANVSKAPGLTETPTAAQRIEM